MDYLTKDEAKELFSSLLTEGLGQLETNLSRQLQTQAEQLSRRAESSSSLDWLDSLIQEAEGLEGIEEDTETPDAAYDESDLGDIANNPAIAQLKQKLSTLERENTQFRTQWQQEQARREQAEEDTRVNGMRATAIQDLSLGNRVVNPAQMLSLLLQEGRVIEQGDQYVVKKTDKHGDLFVPLKDELDGLLTTDYSHFAARREGTGSGAYPGSPPRTPVTSFKYFDHDGKPTVDPGQAMQTDRAGYLQELAAVQPR
ncbi:hypothetical protein [Stenomitos frigidus]|uniref:Uncharacterized protein n=1 Tax=Stenomitos frigidus ULC18 TaxID=2107698 RepID=A0A2T1E0F3_9CYAN|nr:hypothetical protein [Stenomitos frigidus]PSB26212.1 hypothetical protein C7B82_20550 [Stenomitos frigidus ULC18]